MNPGTLPLFTTRGGLSSTETEATGDVPLDGVAFSQLHGLAIMGLHF